MSVTAEPPAIAEPPTAQKERRSGVFSRELVIQAIRDSFPKLDPGCS